jgi:hypothetical protein
MTERRTLVAHVAEYRVSFTLDGVSKALTTLDDFRNWLIRAA